MDDSYVIHRDREFLVQLEIEIAEKAKELGMTLNRKKTRIVKLSDTINFCKSHILLPILVGLLEK